MLASRALGAHINGAALVNGQPLLQVQPSRGYLPSDKSECTSAQTTWRVWALKLPV